jgi:hypothetical protein
MGDSIKNKIVGGIVGVAILGGGTVADKQINPYTDKGAALEMSLTSDIGQIEKAEISKTNNSVTLKRWGGDSNIVIIPIEDTKEIGRGVLSKTLKAESKDGKKTVVIEPTENGDGVNIDTILNEKPNTNIFQYEIQGSEGMDFLYQPELTAAEKARGVERPENVVGSYAVYSKAKKDNKYSTGKLFHIYRPKIIDAKGNETWGELAYANGVLSVGVPQEFLDAAAYPVRVDPTFGYTTQGASDGVICASTFDGRAGMRADSITGTLVDTAAYTKSSAAGSLNYFNSVYSNNGGTGKPNAALKSGASTARSNTSYTLFTQTLASTTLTGTNYWAVIDGSGGAPGVGCRVAFDSGNTTNYGALFASDSGVWTLDSNRYSLYSDYTNVAFDATSTIISTGFAAGNTYTGTHVDGSGTNRLMTLCALLWQDVAGTGSISAASYNSAAMTLASTTRSGSMRVEMWYLVAPSTGSNTTSVTVNGNTDDRKFIWTTYTGVDQSTPIERATSNTGTATTIATTTAAALQNNMLQDCVSRFGTASLSPYLGQEKLAVDVSGSTGIISSTEATTTNSTGGMRETAASGAGDWSYMTISIRGTAPSASIPVLQDDGQWFSLFD